MVVTLGNENKDKHFENVDVYITVGDKKGKVSNVEQSNTYSAISIKIKFFPPATLHIGLGNISRVRPEGGFKNRIPDLTKHNSGSCY